MVSRSILVVSAIGVFGLLAAKVKIFKDKIDMQSALDEINKFLDPAPLVMETIGDLENQI